MINEERLVGLLNSGVQSWNDWRSSNRSIRIRLCGVNLSGLDLTNADLHNMDLSDADLSESDLSGAYLEDVKLTGANLSGTRLVKACLRRADLKRVNLRAADLTESDLRFADLISANLQEANLTAADLRQGSFGLARLDKARLNLAILTDADFQSAVLDDASLYHCRIDRANFHSASLKKAVLSECTARGANFTKACLVEASLVCASMEGVNLEHVDLSRAGLRKCNLSGASLEGACLAGADLTGACLDGIPSTCFSAEESCWEGASLLGVVFKSDTSRILYGIGDIASNFNVVTDSDVLLRAIAYKRMRTINSEIERGSKDLEKTFRRLYERFFILGLYGLVPIYILSCAAFVAAQGSSWRSYLLPVLVIPLAYFLLGCLGLITQLHVMAFSYFHRCWRYRSVLNGVDRYAMIGMIGCVLGLPICALVYATGGNTGEDNFEPHPVMALVFVVMYGALCVAGLVVGKVLDSRERGINQDALRQTSRERSAKNAS